MKRSPLYAFARTLLPWLFHVLMPIKVINPENMPETGKIILCCNHLSMTDPVRLAFSQNRQIFYMAKSELFQNKFVAAVISALGAFPVSRGKSDRQAINTAKKHLDHGHVLGIFIEGTRSKNGELLRPKSGSVMLAHSCSAPILPCCITAKNGGLPKLFQTCLISFGKIIESEELGIKNGTPSEYREASRQVMERIAQLREASLNEFSKKENHT